MAITSARLLDPSSETQCISSKTSHPSLLRHVRTLLCLLFRRSSPFRQNPNTWRESFSLVTTGNIERPAWNGAHSCRITRHFYGICEFRWRYVLFMNYQELALGKAWPLGASYSQSNQQETEQSTVHCVMLSTWTQCLCISQYWAAAYLYYSTSAVFKYCGTQTCDFYMVREQLSTEHLMKK